MTDVTKEKGALVAEKKKLAEQARKEGDIIKALKTQQEELTSQVQDLGEKLEETTVQLEVSNTQYAEFKQETSSKIEGVNEIEKKLA